MGKMLAVGRTKGDPPMSAPVRQAVSTMLRLVTVLAAVVAATVLSTQSATAADCNIQNPDGSINYGCVKPGNPNGNGNGNGGIPGVGSGSDGGVSTPSCDLVAPATFCMGSSACWYLPSVVPYAPPKGDPPDGDREQLGGAVLPVHGRRDRDPGRVDGRQEHASPAAVARGAGTDRVRQADARRRHAGLQPPHDEPGHPADLVLGRRPAGRPHRLLRLRPGRDRPAAEPPGHPR